MKYICPWPRGANFRTCQMTHSSLNLSTTQCGNMFKDEHSMKTHKIHEQLTMSISRDILLASQI